MNSSTLRSSCRPPAPEAFRLHDAAWRQASIARALGHWDQQSDLWIFGYGSLIWNPDFDFLESRRARVHGYHRALCLWSRVNRGTPERPGLVFGLDRGGACTGQVFRIAGAQVPTIMQTLWQREMPSASYIPRWLDCHTREGVVSGLVFTMDRSSSGYIPNLSLEQTVAIVRQGHGRYGPCTDYVLETAAVLESTGIVDQKLRAIAQALKHPLSLSI